MEEISNMYQKQHKEGAIHKAVTTAVFIVLHTCGCMQRLPWCVLIITTGCLVQCI